MDEFLDSGIGSNIRLLPDLYRSLKIEQTVLTGQLTGDSSLGHNEWLHVLADIHDTISHLEHLHGQLESVTCDVMGGRQCGEESGDVVRGVASLVHEIGELDCCEGYLTWIRYVTHLSGEINKFVESLTSSPASSPSSSFPFSTASEALQCYLEIVELSVRIEDSDCHNLKKWILSVRNHANKTLKLKLTSAFNSLLTSLIWPITSSAISSHDINRWDKENTKFSKLFLNLMKLESQALLQHNGGVVRSHDLSIPLPLPLEVMVTPLRKRFKYHFMENRKTNNLEKPEWYLTQVSNWLRDHTPILDQRVQPILNESGYSHINAKFEFSRGLLQEVIAKLEWDMKDMISHDSIVAHLIDELLLFQRELRTILPPPPPSDPPIICRHSNSLTVLHVLLNEVTFDKWRNLEKSYAVERLKEMTSSDLAWMPTSSNLSWTSGDSSLAWTSGDSSLAWTSGDSSLACMPGDSADDSNGSKVPQCTEKLMMLIKGITERYRLLPSQHHQLMFLELQVDLLLEFHQDLSHAANRTHTLDPQYSAYLNASHYINTVLLQWGREQFFLDLVYYSRHTYSDENISYTHDNPLKKDLTDVAYGYGGDSVFDAVISSFSSLVEDMEEAITTYVVQQSKQLSHKYKAEKWHNMKFYDYDDILSMDLSCGAAELLISLRNHFLLLENSISSILFPIVMEKISQGLDDVILNEVVLSNHFNKDGAKQLKYDLEQYFIPLLSKYCDQVIQKKIFVKTLEAVLLLSSLPGTALLLSDLLRDATNTIMTEQALVDVDTALHNVGVHFLTHIQTKLILQNRIYESS